MQELNYEQESELGMLVYDKTEQETIRELISLVPVNWNTIKEMILIGFTASEISSKCNEWDTKGFNIKEVFELVKMYL